MSDAVAVASDVMTRGRRLVDPALQSALTGLHPELRHAAEYHLGFVEADGTRAAGRGKGIRAALALLSAEAVGARPEIAVPGAVAVELVHNFSLLHDDIIDGDDRRRHRPTVWALFGVGQAILVGDALQTVAHQVLLDEGTPRALAASTLLADAVQAMIAGQADDMALETAERVDVEECTRMVAGKTGALLSCAAAIGAVLAGAEARPVGALGDFGAELGLSFQAVDDILGIWGDPHVTGKPVGSDLTSKKKTLPVAFAMAASPEARSELGRMFRNGELDEAAVRQATTVIERTGGRDATEEFASRHLALALQALETDGLDSRATSDLRRVADYVCERQL